MAYGEYTESAVGFLRQRVAEAMVSAAQPLLGSANPNLKAMAEAIVQSPQRIAPQLTLFVRALHGVGPASTDAEIDTAISDSETVEMLQRHLGIGII